MSGGARLAAVPLQNSICKIILGNGWILPIEITNLVEDAALHSHRGGCNFGSVRCTYDVKVLFHQNHPFHGIIAIEDQKIQTMKHGVVVGWSADRRHSEWDSSVGGRGYVDWEWISHMDDMWGADCGEPSKRAISASKPDRAYPCSRCGHLWSKCGQLHGLFPFPSQGFQRVIPYRSPFDRTDRSDKLEQNRQP